VPLMDHRAFIDEASPDLRKTVGDRACAALSEGDYTCVLLQNAIATSSLQCHRKGSCARGLNSH